jgi:hypothetical protein
MRKDRFDRTIMIPLHEKNSAAFKGGAAAVSFVFL